MADRPADGAPTTAPAYVRSSRYEIWKRVEGGVNDAATWMVWEIGPYTGGEHWFTSEDECREFIADRLTDKPARAEAGT